MLCDTGACMTVLTEEPPRTHFSKDARVVTSASGHTTTQLLTQKLDFLHANSDRKCKLQCIIDSSCPVNLLGRDGLMKLRIGVVPESNGMRAELMLSESHTLVCHGDGEPHYYWTLDLPSSKQLITITERYLPRTSEVMPHNELHHTLRFKQTPGPDPEYDTQVHRLGPQKLTLQHLYVTKSGNAVCSVIQPPRVRDLNRMPAPHVSTAKNSQTQWKDLGIVLKRVQDDYYEKTEDTHEGWLQGRRTGCMRYTLGWVLNVKPSTHLTDSPASCLVTERAE